MTTIAVPSPTTAKLGRVATIGYHQPQAWQIVTRMVDEQGWSLVGIRYNRRSYLEEWSGSSLRRHFRYSYHAVPAACAVDLPLWCFETVALLQRYGLLTPLSHARQEQQHENR